MKFRYFGQLITMLSVALFAVAHSSAQQWGDLTGTIVYDGATAPKPPKIDVTKDKEVCGKHNLVEEGLLVNPDNKGLADVLVYLYPSRGTKVKPHPDYAKTAKAEVRLDNENCRYEPRVVLLRTTQTLVIGNKDPIGHNTKIETISNPAINPIIPAGTDQKYNFKLPEKRPANVGCNIHPWMSATMLVQSHPYMAATDEDGKFTIKNLPVGEWTFQFRHKAGYLSAVKVNGKATKWSRGRPKLTIKPGANDLGTIAAPASMFK